jgi:hypothetical protein
LVDPSNAWITEFFDFAIRQSEDNAAMVADVVAAAEPDGARWAIGENGALLFSALAENGDVLRLRRLIALGPPALRKHLADRSLSAGSASQEYGWLGWTPVLDGANGAQLGPTESGGFGVLAYAGPGEQERPLLRRAFLLAPGRYSLVDRRQQAGGDASSRLFWSIACHSESDWRELSRSDAGVSGDRIDFDVGPDCPLQLVQLLATTGRGGEGLQVLIDGVRITAR